MDVNKMNWCLKNGSSGTKEKLVALLSNINSVIGDEMKKGNQSSSTDFESLVDDAHSSGYFLNGNRNVSTTVDACRSQFTYKHNINDEAVKNFEQDAALIELETAHFPGGQEVVDEEEGDFLSGNRLILSADIDVHLSDANVLADQHVAGEVLVSMDKQKTDSIELGTKIDNSQVADEEVSAEAYEFDDIIDYEPVSDDDEAIDEGGHEIQIDENEETYDALDRIFKSTGLNSSRIEANVLFDGTLQVEEVTGGSICEPPQQNFKCGSCDKTEMHVDTSDGSENKKNCCPYCFKLQSKLARHIVDLHTEEADVQNLLKFDIGSKERKKMLDALKKRGNTRFNTDPKINKGKKMIVSRRPNSKFKRTGKDFRICAFCLGTYSMTSTRQHICTRKAAKGDRSLINLSRMVEGRWHKDASKALQTAMSGFNEDDIATLAKYDWLMITFGNSFCEQLDTLRQQKLVRQQLRILSRLLIEVKNNEATVTDFASIFQTNFVDSVIAAIRVIGRFNSTTNYFKSPSPATNLVTLVKKVGLLLRDECIANKNKQLKEQTEDFIALFTSRSTIKINKLAAKSRAKMSLERVETMPTTDEINKFQEFLNRKCDEYCQLLNAGSFADEREFSRTWIKLVEVTLVSIMMFNRRRVGEMQLCEISNYIRREKVTQDSKDLLFMTLSNESKKRVMRYSRMVMLGKRHVPVAVLLNPDIENRIDIILKFREAAGVPSTNQILFALPSSFEEKPRIVDACAALRKLTVESGIDNPKDIRGTKMRKHFANFCAAKGINDNTVTDVANFMGHSVDIHKQFYRGNALDRQVARISELLEESSGQSVSEVGSIGSSIDKQRQRQSLTQQTDTNFNPTVFKKLKKQPTTRDNNRMPTNSTRKSESNFVHNKRKNPSSRSKLEAENPIVNKKRKVQLKDVELDPKRPSTHTGTASRKKKM